MNKYWQREQAAEDSYYNTYKSHFFLTGEIIQPFLVSLIDLIDENMKKLDINKSFRTKVKFVCIEIIENALKHGDTSQKYPTFFRIGFSNDKVLVECGNPINEKSFQKLKEMSADLQNQSLEDIKKSYEEQLKSDDFYKTGNGGLGLFTIAIRTDLHCDFDFRTDENNEHYFIINASLLNPVAV